MRTLFLTSSFNKVADDVLSHIPKAAKRITFVTTASETYTGETPWLDADRAVLRDRGYEVINFSFTGKKAPDVQAVLSDTDLLFVAGGNTYYLMQEIQRSGSADVLRTFLDDGGIYIGSSAGSIIMCPTFGWTGWLDDSSRAPDLTGLHGLGVVSFLIMPHWGSEKYTERHRSHNVPLLQKEPYPIVLLADTQYVHVVGDTIEIVDVRM